MRALRPAYGAEAVYDDSDHHGVVHPCLQPPTLTVTGDGDELVYRDEQGRFHREDGPALITATGREEWFWCGTRHRDRGPAVVTADGMMMWYRHGRLHREDGPAVIYPGDHEEWWLHGRRTAPTIAMLAAAAQAAAHDSIGRRGSLVRRTRS